MPPRRPTHPPSLQRPPLLHNTPACLKDLARFLRRDNPEDRDAFFKLGELQVRHWPALDASVSCRECLHLMQRLANFNATEMQKGSRLNRSLLVALQLRVQPAVQSRPGRCLQRRSAAPPDDLQLTNRAAPTPQIASSSLVPLLVTYPHDEDLAFNARECAF